MMSEGFFPITRIFVYSAAAFFAFTFLSCENKTNDTANKSDADTVVASSSVDSLSDFQELTESWSSSLNMKNAPIMLSFYFDTVMYYGDAVSREEIVRKQKNYFTRYPDYRQRIKEHIDAEQQPDGSWKVRFIKEVTAGGQTSEYPSSIVYRKTGGIWKIAVESDDITDIIKARQGKGREVHYEPEVVTLEGLIEENTGFSVPAYGEDLKSDARETYFVIVLQEPLDVIGSTDKGKEFNTTERGLMRIQLDGDKKMLKPLLNKKVKLMGTIFHAQTSHHHTNVLLDVKTAEPLK
ncbi:MAG: hypothetical protein Fur0041_21450 [Bacteroidia bacterium]